mmetsp:Transcript_66459/g.138794  ORF Transcript_66459/g.138794 Transcript_66459/m.138794 type:complete len:139 (+) Transcript_66459:287-703(+)
MSGTKVADGSGLKFDPNDSFNMYGQVELSTGEVAVMQKLFDATTIKRYTRDRKGEAVPDAFEVVRGYRVQNARNFAEFATRRDAIRSVLMQKDKAKQKIPADLKEYAPLKTVGALPTTEEFRLDADTKAFPRYDRRCC